MSLTDGKLNSVILDIFNCEIKAVIVHPISCLCNCKIKNWAMLCIIAWWAL